MGKGVAMDIVAGTAGMITASAITPKAKLNKNVSKQKAPQKPPNFN